ncbi:MAG: hypothetical protein NTX63_01740 [Candidatus Peregrinibacteria bacterium]|nr:hypothetical protein [Candidatus Peregrinibacteria bacterium]
MGISSFIRNFRDPPMIKQQKLLRDLIGEGRDRCCEKVCRRCTKVSKIKILRAEIDKTMKAVLEISQLADILRNHKLSIKIEQTRDLGEITPQGIVIGHCVNDVNEAFSVIYDEKKKDESAFTIMKYSLNI